MKVQTYKEDIVVLELAIKRLSLAFDEFIGECIGENGKPKQPNYGALMKARGYLPPYCEHSLSKRDGL